MSSMTTNINYKSTSKLRRKCKTKLTCFKDKIQKELSHSLNEIINGDRDIAVRFRKILDRENYDSKLHSSSGDLEIGSLFPSEGILDVDSSDDDSEDESKYEVFWDEVEHLNIVKRFGLKLNKILQTSNRSEEMDKNPEFKVWNSVLTIILIKGTNISPIDSSKNTPHPYCTVKWGNEKFKSNVQKSSNPIWLQKIVLQSSEDTDQQLEIIIWDSNHISEKHLGRCLIDLGELEKEQTHAVNQQLEGNTGSLHFLLTISGSTANEVIPEDLLEMETIKERYIYQNTFVNIEDIGQLVVKVFEAQGLAATNMNNGSDTFCFLELGNSRVKTHTEYNTLSPTWNKAFNFRVKDINDVLEVTVIDVDVDDKVDVLGKIAIPLLNIKSGEKRWYSLKNKSLKRHAGGNSPKILLELMIYWNPIRACIRTLKPKEEKYMPTERKFNRKIFVQNILRLKLLIIYLIEGVKLFQKSLKCESIPQIFSLLIVWLSICYVFQPWMIPASGLVVMFKEYLDMQAAKRNRDREEENKEGLAKSNKRKKNLKRKIGSMKEIPQDAQNIIGDLVSFVERFKNLFNFTVPFISYIMIFILSMGSILLYLIPLRYCFMLAGIGMFMKKLIAPYKVPDNEILNLISRVPDDEMVLEYEEIEISDNTELERTPPIFNKTATWHSYLEEPSESAFN